jgi:hypothetical protein
MIKVPQPATPTENSVFDWLIWDLKLSVPSYRHIISASTLMPSRPFEAATAVSASLQLGCCG